MAAQTGEKAFCFSAQIFSWKIFQNQSNVGKFKAQQCDEVNADVHLQKQVTLPTIPHS